MNTTQFHELLIKNMKYHRRRKGYSQVKLAQLCAVSANYISEIEMGRKFPSADTMERIVAALEIKPHELFVDDRLTPEFEEVLASYTIKLKNALYAQVDDVLKGYYHTSSTNINKDANKRV